MRYIKLLHDDGLPWIFSFAHSGCEYELKHNFASIEARINATREVSAGRVLYHLAPDADLDAGEISQLFKIAARRCGASQRDLRTMLKAEVDKRGNKRAQQARERYSAENTRVVLMTPKADAPAGPVMAEWDEILSRVTVPEPPMRDIDGWPAYIRSRNSAGLHELTARSANAEEDETSRLPAPKHLLLTRHDECSLEIEIGDHIDFVVPTKSGCASVAPPARFLTHYLKYGRSNLPVVASVVTMPLVLSDGSLLSQNGLDRARRLLTPNRSRASPIFTGPTRL